MPLAQIFGPVPAAHLAQDFDLKSAPSTPTPIPASASSCPARVRGQYELSEILASANVGVVELGCFHGDIVIAILRR